MILEMKILNLIMKLNDFYSHDLSLNFQKVLPDGKFSYDFFESVSQVLDMFQVIFKY